MRDPLVSQYLCCGQLGGGGVAQTAGASVCRKPGAVGLPLNCKTVLKMDVRGHGRGRGGAQGGAQETGWGGGGVGWERPHPLGQSVPLLCSIGWGVGGLGTSTSFGAVPIHQTSAPRRQTPIGALAPKLGQATFDVGAFGADPG